MPKRIIAQANNAKWMENCCAAIIVTVVAVVVAVVVVATWQPSARKPVRTACA